MPQLRIVEPCDQQERDNHLRKERNRYIRENALVRIRHIDQVPVYSRPQMEAHRILCNLSA